MDTTRMPEPVYMDLRVSDLLQDRENNRVEYLRIVDEPESMERFLGCAAPVWDALHALRGLDMHQLSSYEEAGTQQLARRFFGVLPQRCRQLERLRVGKVCLDQDNGADAHGVWDVERLVDALPKLQRLRSLGLAELELSSEDGFHVVQACGRCPVLTRLDLSCNGMYNLDEIVQEAAPVEAFHLEELDLSANCFGEIEDESVGMERTCTALLRLLAQYTSLRTLDLSANSLGNLEGLAIATALDSCTHLRALAVVDNDWNASVRRSIRAAWRGEAAGLAM